MGRINHQVGERLFPISISFLIIFVLLVSPVSSLEDVIDDDCNINQDVFDRDWKKYSDIDERTPLHEREWPAQQYGVTESKIVDAKLQIYFLKRDMEIDRLVRLELKEYKKELVEGHRDNLLKSFARLSFLTVHTVYEAYGAGKSVGDSYVNLFTTPSSASAAGSVLKITNTYKSMAPPKSTALAKNTQSITKSVDAVSKNVASEALESLGDPTKVGVALVTGVIDAVPVPHKAKDWKLTDDDFNILRKEHLENKKIGETIAKSYKVNLERKDKVRELEAQIKELKKELAEWEAKEKSRVKASLVDSCKDGKKDEEEVHDEISTSKWYVYHTCDLTGWWCQLNYRKMTEKELSNHNDYIILDSYETEQKLLDAVCDQISDFYCTGGPTAISPSGPKGNFAGNTFALNYFLIKDDDTGNFECPRTYLGAYKCRKPD